MPTSPSSRRTSSARLHDRNKAATALIRLAGHDDALRVASLHAASWRAHYRGAMSDAYLEGPVEAERAAFWTDRLGHPRPGQVVLLAEDAATLVGFVCLFLDHDRVFGSFVDNLHVEFDRKRQGLGRTIMHAAAQAMHHALPLRPAYLYVLEWNATACSFYDRIGGRVVEHGRQTEPDGSEVPVKRYLWDSPAVLLAGTAA